MRSSFRVLAPALRQATQASSRATAGTSSRSKLLLSVGAGATLAYALIPHKQPLLLDSERKTRSIWEDPPPPKPKSAEPEQPEGSASDAQTQTEEEEDPKSAAFDPVTGEINWDCSCLGGMAHGPCGEEFREAFSCFIYSEEEPKGINCVEKFKGMQDCFRAHPDVYGEELADEDKPASTEGDAAKPEPILASSSTADESSSTSTESLIKAAEEALSLTSRTTTTPQPPAPETEAPAESHSEESPAPSEFEPESKEEVESESESEPAKPRTRSAWA